jgi:Secretion system C-terminal sorting domain
MKQKSLQKSKPTRLLYIKKSNNSTKKTIFLIIYQNGYVPLCYKIVYMKKIYTLLFIGMSYSAQAQIPFYINNLSSGGPVIVDHFATTGDDRGGIAVNINNVYETGDSATTVFNKALTNQQETLHRIDGLVCNISGNGGIYAMYAGGQPMTFSGPTGGGLLSELVKLDPLTLNVVGTLAVTPNVPLNNFIGIFSGTGYCLIQDNDDVYKIDFLTGTSTLLTGAFNSSIVTRNLCENGASWGVAEYDGTNYSLAYVKNSTTIESRYIHNSTVRATFPFVNLGDMCSFVLSPWNNRWYFHYEGNAQFGGVTETIGSAEASYFGAVPLNVGFGEVIASQKDINSALISWKVQKEENVQKYIIEKLNANSEFYAIGTVAPNGTYYYTFTDNEATNTKNIYRITAVENNSELFFSNVVTTNNSYRTIQDITITPNPAVNAINIFLGAKAKNGQVEIINNMGQIVKTQIITKDYITLDIDNLPKGLYHVSVQNTDFIGSGKFLKK